MSNERVVLYVYGVFDTPDSSQWPNFSSYIADIEASQFNTVILSTFHVDTDGNLYGSAPLVGNGIFNPSGDVDPNLPSLYQGLAASGVTLLYSIGNSAGTVNDMAALEQILANPTSAAYANLKQNMQVLATDLAISGIDFDFEPFTYTAELRKVVSDFTLFCSNLGFTVTYCPYAAESWWIDAQKSAFDAGGAVAWWNLQCYSGGAGNSPATWLPSIVKNATAMGVSDPTTFIVPGVDAGGGPAAVQSAVAAFEQGAPGMNGAFVWQLGEILGSSSSVADYATAVVEGLQQTTLAR